MWFRYEQMFKINGHRAAYLSFDEYCSSDAVKDLLRSSISTHLIHVTVILWTLFSYALNPHSLESLGAIHILRERAHGRVGLFE